MYYIYTSVYVYIYILKCASASVRGVMDIDIIHDLIYDIRIGCESG